MRSSASSATSPTDAGSINRSSWRRPPERALRWACDAVGRGSRIASLRPFPQGGWLANHALAIVDRRGTTHRLVLRRWARPDWATEDPDFTAAREATALDLLATTSVPAPRVVAADFEGAVCDVPTLLITRIPGHAPGLPNDIDAFLRQLAEALHEVHAVNRGAAERLRAYRTYYEPGTMTPPTWSTRTELWERAVELARAAPPQGTPTFIHRDYHPENTLWSRGRLTGIVDWTSASWGPAEVDTGHMRWNLAITYGIDAADEFLRYFHAITDRATSAQLYWDLVGVLDVLPEVDPTDWPAFVLARLERYVESAIART